MKALLIALALLATVAQCSNFFDQSFQTLKVMSQMLEK